MKTATVRLVFGVLMAAALATGCASSRYPANAKLKTGSGPLVQAHRGGRFEYDDNALGGFEMCLSRGIKGFELDVRYTKDCVLVVMHDESLERTTNGMRTRLSRISASFASRSLPSRCRLFRKCLWRCADVRTFSWRSR